MAWATGEPSGRIRLREPQAQLLWKLLWEHYGDLIHDRWEAKQRGEPVPHQRALAVADSIKNELRRTADEMGWELHDRSAETDLTTPPA